MAPAWLALLLAVLGEAHRFSETSSVEPVAPRGARPEGASLAQREGGALEASRGWGRFGKFSRTRMFSDACLASLLGGMAAGFRYGTLPQPTEMQLPRSWEGRFVRSMTTPIHRSRHSIISVAKVRGRGTVVAIKELLGSGRAHQRPVEVAVLDRLQGPGVVTLYQAEEVPGRACRNHTLMMMEAARGDLHDEVLTRRRAIPYATKLQLLADLLHGLKRIAEAGYVHRDIHSSHLLIFGDCLDGGCRLKIGDFRLACSVAGEEPACEGVPRHFESSAWRAPEYTPVHDVWGAGIVLYEMLYGHLPTFAGRRARRDPHCGEDANLQQLRRNDPGLYHILECMLQVDVRSRCSAAHALVMLRHHAEARSIPLLLEEEPIARASGPRAPPGWDDKMWHALLAKFDEYMDEEDLP